MTRALALFGLLLCPSSALAQPMPAPWVAHELPERFGVARLACADGAAFARSWQGQVARFDGRAWTAIAPVPGPRNVGRALWADPAGEVLFTTTEHAILRFSGGAWSSMDAPLASRAPYPIVSFGGEHAFTVGPERVIAWPWARRAERSG